MNNVTDIKPVEKPAEKTVEKPKSTSLSAREEYRRTTVYEGYNYAYDRATHIINVANKAGMELHIKVESCPGGWRLVVDK